MILVGSQRGGGRDLANHLLKDENDHVEIVELRGFASQSLHGAFQEAYALSKGTRAKQFLFSLSVNPPANERVTSDELIAAVDRAEAALGLSGQSRAVVFHEKEGRRHAHAVWSRIDVNAMKAIHLPHTKRELTKLTKDLFIEHGWQMPPGLIDPSLRDPRNFDLHQWQQAKRAGKDPRAIKSVLQDAWAISDGRASLEHALLERGYRLCRGDRRGFVVIDHRLEVYSLPRWLGLDKRKVGERLGDHAELPGVEETKAAIAQDMRRTIDRLQGELRGKRDRKREGLEARRKALVTRQRAQRDALFAHHTKRRALENRARAARFRSGLAGVWDVIRGHHRKIALRNEAEALACERRDRREKDALSFGHLKARQHVNILKMRLAVAFGRVRHELEKDEKTYVLKPPPMPERAASSERAAGRKRTRPRRSRGPEPG